ncbi:MAG: phosphoenolpyruvate carboxykinase (ATP) [Acidobacteria bacterium]|nr:phosphoenolpyruvate carboxykinase (ATP) [Acidobacteriota bacterium]
MEHCGSTRSVHSGGADQKLKTEHTHRLQRKPVWPAAEEKVGSKSVQFSQDGIQTSDALCNLAPARLVEESLERGEGILTESGALRVTTGKYTGRSPNDKFIVEEPGFSERIWWGPTNRPFPADRFDRLYKKMAQYLRDRHLYIFNGFAGADPKYRLPIRVINEKAWHNLFVHQLFLRPSPEELANHNPRFTIVATPGFKANPKEDGTNSEAFILLSFTRGLVLIGGTEYAGEMKKSIFTVMNFLMPQQGVTPMHCSANQGADGNVALFFGLSGTGKTTLSADPQRRLIGDDEHGWSDHGVFNFEGGCYAKCINLSREKEPQIWEAIRFGSVLENVVVDNCTGRVDYNNASLTENTRAAYPVDYIPNAIIPGAGGHPKVIIFLTADAFGVLPPIARLTREQAMYHFISGYTSKLAGTERGVTEPQTAFSSCFGAPFLPLHPLEYAQMLARRIEQQQARVYLVNTGWTGGSYGQGQRIDLKYTRALIAAALNAELEKAHFHPHPVFQVAMPDSCPGVPSAVLEPRGTWPDPAAYDRKAQELAKRFAENFAKYSGVPDEIIAAGPRV